MVFSDLLKLILTLDLNIKAGSGLNFASFFAWSDHVNGSRQPNCYHIWPIHSKIHCLFVDYVCYKFPNAKATDIKQVMAQKLKDSRRKKALCSMIIKPEQIDRNEYF